MSGKKGILHKTTLDLITEVQKILNKTHPMTVRQVFYQLLPRGHPKTENFSRSLGEAIGIARDNGVIPWDHIVDSSRMRTFPNVFKDFNAWKKAALYSLKFPFWADPPIVFIEKRALMEVIRPVLDEYRVPAVALSGYCSKTILNEHRTNKIIYLGDWDADGICISDSAKKYCPDLTRIALNENQIAVYDLPTRPQKKGGKNYRAEKWGDHAVELDALPVTTLKQILRDELEKRIDKEYRKDAIWRETHYKNTLEIHDPDDDLI